MESLTSLECHDLNMRGYMCDPTVALMNASAHVWVCQELATNYSSHLRRAVYLCFASAHYFHI